MIEIIDTGQSEDSLQVEADASLYYPPWRFLPPSFCFQPMREMIPFEVIKFG